jgi:hypothetical protein
MHRKKNASLTPSIDTLEVRLAPSGAQFTPWGAAILTTSAYRQAAAGIQSAFVRFATHGMNYNRLNADLAMAVSVIPYNLRDGLQGALRNECVTMSQRIASGVPGSVVGALARAEADLQAFVQHEVASGQVVLR